MGHRQARASSLRPPVTRASLCGALMVLMWEILARLSSGISMTLQHGEALLPVLLPHCHLFSLACRKRLCSTRRMLCNRLICLMQQWDPCFARHPGILMSAVCTALVTKCYLSASWSLIQTADCVFVAVSLACFCFSIRIAYPRQGRTTCANYCMNHFLSFQTLRLGNNYQSKHAA